MSDIFNIENSILNKDSLWDFKVQKHLSNTKFPDYLIGTRRDIVQGDISREWLNWIVSQFLDSSFFIKETKFIEIYSNVLTSIKLLSGLNISSDEISPLCIEISKNIKNILDENQKKKEKRKSISRSIKEDLLSIYSYRGELRCWLTGYKFTEDAIYNFLKTPKEELVELKLPVFIDKYRPIGSIQRDLGIEIDHLYPFSLGGPDQIDNYRLICGWANKVKSNHLSTYSTGTRVKGNNPLYPTSYYYWASRVIGLRRKCEEPGCKNNIYNSELTICSHLGPNKAINPVSMKVVCKQHDRRGSRYIKREDLECWNGI